MSRRISLLSLLVLVVGMAMALVPSQHAYWKGTSYLSAIEILLPNILLGFERVQELEGIGPWITEQAFGATIHTTHGRGGSIAMEAYMNFGFMGGIIFFIFLGMFYRFIYERFLARPDFLRTVLVLAVTSAIMLWTRNTFNQAIRPLVWPCLMALVLQSLFSV